MDKNEIRAFEVVVIAGLNNKEAGFNDDLRSMKDAFNNYVFSNLYCLQYLYLGLMRKYEIQAPMKVRFIAFKDFNPEEKYFEEMDPFFDVTPKRIEYRKRELLKNPLTVSPTYEFLKNKKEVGEWIDKIYDENISFFEHPTNGLEALYTGLVGSFEEHSHKVFILVSDNDAKPLGGPYPIFKPEHRPKDNEELKATWDKLSTDATVVFFSEEGSIYQDLAEEWDNAFFHPIENLFDFSRIEIIHVIKEHMGEKDE